jgi:hypothetical protein
MRSIVRSLVTGLLLFGAAGCEPKVVSYQVRIITSACVAPSPIEGVTHLKFRVTGEGISQPLEQVARMADAVQKVPEIPAGPARVVQVRAYAGDPTAGGRLISMGHSLPFDVPDEVPADGGPKETAVFLRRVNAFTPPSLTASPTTCTRLRDARAGHSATLLGDGRVFIAGGFNMKSDDGGRTFYRSTLHGAEIFNPATGAFDDAPELGVFNNQQLFTPTPRAFHGAVWLGGGRVLLAGGEVRSGQTYFATPSALIYDDGTRSYGAYQMKQARIGPGVARDGGGRVLVVGGTDTFGNPVPSAEWYDPARPFGNADPADPSRENPRALGQQVPRVGMAMAAVQGGDYLAVAGGWDGARLADEVLFFRFDGSTFLSSASSVRLNQPRRGAGIGWFGDRNKLLLVGGWGSGTELELPLSSSELLSTQDAFSLAPGQPVSVARGDVCVATLPDGRVLTIGGRVSAGGQTESSVKVELMTPLASGGSAVEELPGLPVGRFHHTCTTLQDGSVLVLGGVRQGADDQVSLADALLFVPAPLD